MAVTAQCGFCWRATDARSEIGPDAVRDTSPDAAHEQPPLHEHAPFKVTYCAECNAWYQRLITYGQGTPISSEWRLEEPSGPEGQTRSA